MQGTAAGATAKQITFDPIMAGNAAVLAEATVVLRAVPKDFCY